MYTLIKQNMTILLFALVLLCSFDAAFTDIGLRLRLIDELNPIVWFIYDRSIIAYYGLKLLLPLLLIVIYFKLDNHVWLNPCILVTFLIYAGVNVYHLVWFAYSYYHGFISFS